MKKQNKKVILLFFIVLTYTILYKLISFNEKSTTSIDIKDIYRPDYLDVIIKAEPKTEINTQTPVQITNRNKSVIIKNVFIKKQLNNEFENEKKFLVEVPQKYTQIVLNSNDLEIHHFKINFKQKKSGHSYEITY